PDRRRALMLDELHEPAQRDAAAHRPDAAAEQRQPLAAAHQQARERDQDQLSAVAFRWPTGIGDISGRAVIHRGRRVAPQPDALGRLPFGLADVEALRFGALAPIDTSCGIARLVLAELPEGLALPHPPPAMHSLCDGGGDSLSRDQQRRQNGSRLLRPVAQTGTQRTRSARPPGKPADGLPADSLGRDHRSGIVMSSITCVTVTPSARPAKLTAMRWRSTGGANARTSSIDGA